MRSDEPIDIARFASEHIEDAREAMAESYAFIGTQLVAVLQRTGPVTLPRDYDVRAHGLVVYAEPLPGGAWRVSVIPREESGRDVAADSAAARAAFDRQYVRRDG